MKRSIASQNLGEVLFFVELGLSLLTGFRLKHTQRLAVALLVKSDSNGLLEQVSTGEGKTIIIVAFCIIKNLIGHSVDVITSSLVLAERDATANQEYFELFGVGVTIIAKTSRKELRRIRKILFTEKLVRFREISCFNSFTTKTRLGKEVLIQLSMKLTVCF